MCQLVLSICFVDFSTWKMMYYLSLNNAYYYQFLWYCSGSFLPSIWWWYVREVSTQTKISFYLSYDIMVQITHSSKDYNQQHATYFTASTIKPKVSVRKLRHIVAIETDNFVTINHWDQKQSRLDNFSKTHKKIIVFKTNGFYERKVSNQETKHTVHG